MNLLFQFIWARWLDGAKVIRVKGWRTALVDTKTGQRQTVTPLFRWER